MDEECLEKFFFFFCYLGLNPIPIRLFFIASIDRGFVIKSFIPAFRHSFLKSSVKADAPIIFTGGISPAATLSHIALVA
jgi:hypothetical protein